MKFKFSKKLKWLGIGAGLTILTTAVAAPVLVSCSDDNGSGGDTGGGQTGGNDNTGNNTGSESIDSILPSDLPTSTFDPNKPSPKGIISSSFLLGSAGGSFAVGDDPSSLTANSAPAASEPQSLPAGVESFSTYSTDTGVAFNMILNKPLKYVAFGQYSNSATNGYSPRGAGTGPNDATKFLFGNNTVATSLIDKRWISANSIDTGKITLNWTKYQTQNNQGFAWKSTSKDELGTAQSFINSTAFDWTIQDTSKDQNLIKSSTFTLNLKYGNLPNQSIEIPIKLNVVYKYRTQESKPLFTKIIEGNVNDGQRMLKLANTDAFYLTKEDGAQYQGTDKFTYSAASIDGKNLLILNTGDLGLSSKDIKALLPTFENMFGSSVTTAAAKNKFLDAEWLVQKDLATLSSGTYSATGVVASWNNRLESNMNINFGNGYFTAVNIPWNGDNNSRAITEDSTNGPSFGQYTQYVDYPLTLSLSKDNNIVSVDVDLRILANTTPFNNFPNLLSVDDSSMLLGTSDNNLKNANSKEGNYLSMNFANNKLSINSIVNMSNAIVDPSTANNYIGFKKYSMSELISNNIINESWLKQKGFSTSAQVEWTSQFEGGQMKFPTLNPTVNAVLETKSINGSEYLVLNQPITEVINYSDDTKFVQNQSQTAPLKLVISEGENKMEFNVDYTITVPAQNAIKAISNGDSKISYTSSDRITWDAATGGNVNWESTIANYDPQFGTEIKLQVKKSVKNLAITTPTIADVFNLMLNDDFKTAYGIKAETDIENVDFVKVDSEINSGSLATLQLTQIVASGINSKVDGKLAFITTNGISDENRGALDNPITAPLKITLTSGVEVTILVTLNVSYLNS